MAGKARDEILRAVVADTDLRSLEKWACSALAARSARRVRPIFASVWKDAPFEASSAIDVALRFVEKAVSSMHASAPKAIKCDNAMQLATCEAVDARLSGALHVRKCIHAALRTVAATVPGEFNAAVNEDWQPTIRGWIGHVAWAALQANLSVCESREVFSGAAEHTRAVTMNREAICHDLNCTTLDNPTRTR